MAISDENIIDGMAIDGQNNSLILEIYDHLDFEGAFEWDHITILQDKLNTYLWYIDSKQYTAPKYSFNTVFRISGCAVSAVFLMKSWMTASRNTEASVNCLKR